MKIIEVVIPLLNEYESFDELANRLKNVKKKLNDEKIKLIFLFVDDGSDKKFKDILRNFCNKNKDFKTINLTRNFGHQVAIRAGIDSSSADAVILMDGDLQDPPEIIPELIKHWKNGYDHVVCVREGRKRENFFKKLTAKYFYKIFNKFANFEVNVDAGDFRLIDKWIVSEISRIKEFNLYIRGFADSLGGNVKKVYYTREPRFGGKPKYNYIQSTKLAINGLFSLTDVFSKILNWLLFFSLLITFGLVIYIFISYLFFNSSLVSGWASVMMVLMLMLLIQILTFIYISFNLTKINHQTADRKNYQLEDQ